MKQALKSKDELLAKNKKIDVDDLGVHSYRVHSYRSGTTFVTTVSTSCNETAVFKRSGWAVENLGMQYDHDLIVSETIK